MSNPHQRIPRQGDSWDAAMSGEKIHFRFETLPKADLTGTVFASPLLVDPVMQGVPLIDGLPRAGGQLVKDVQWATNVSSARIDRHIAPVARRQIVHRVVVRTVIHRQHDGASGLRPHGVRAGAARRGFGQPRHVTLPAIRHKIVQARAGFRR